jgi:DNA-directed RNA polymerase specialized sigma24 family protein
MEWFHSTEREQPERPKNSLASSHEIQSAFAEQRDYLYWIALLITGDDALADLAAVNASALSANYSSVFRDWLIGWATYATVRAAVREVRDLISASASHYADSSSEDSDDDVLSDDQIMSLRNVDPRDIIAALDPLARSALVLRGIQHASIGDCALVLDLPHNFNDSHDNKPMTLSETIGERKSRAICDRTRASGTSRCRDLPASDPTSAKEGRGLGHRADPVRGRPSHRSSHHCRSGKPFRYAG